MIQKTLQVIIIILISCFTTAFSEESQTLGDVNATSVTSPAQNAKALSDYLVSYLGGADLNQTANSAEKILAAEQKLDKVVLFNRDMDWNEDNSIIWSWDPRTLPEGHGAWFVHIDECKPVRNCKLILVTASKGGGVAIVRVNDAKPLFYARPKGSPHSAALLPDDNLAVVSSDGFLGVYLVPNDLSQDDVTVGQKLAYKFELQGAHGVVWDEKRQLLWILGSSELVALQYNHNKQAPDFTLVHRATLPKYLLGGHDLYAPCNYDALVVTGRGVGVFDPDTLEFYPVASYDKIKCLDVSEQGDVLIQRASESYWSDRIRYFREPLDSAQDGEPIGQRDGAKFYKARFFQPTPFSEPQRADRD